jgi:dihydroorotate dehydrogenase electron transfer subunit
VKQSIATVVANEPIADNVFVLRLEEPELARDVRPGQFAHVRCVPPGMNSSDPFLRRPLSVLRTGANPRNELPSDQYEIVYDVVGRGTALLARLGAGEFVDVLGPLGRAFTIERPTARLLLVGGGVGIVPLVALAEEALNRSVSVALLAGFRSDRKLFPARYVPSEVEYVVATNDGTAGHAGFVTELLPSYASWADQVCACGPVPMLRSLAASRIADHLPVQIAMEEHMGCAMGVCLGCVVPTRKGYQRVCRDGPVFDLVDMGWS